MISQKTAYYEGQKQSISTPLQKHLHPAHLQIGQADSVFRVMLLAQEQVPQSSRLGLFLEVFHDGYDRRPSFLEWVFG